MGEMQSSVDFLLLIYDNTRFSVVIWTNFENFSISVNLVSILHL